MGGQLGRSGFGDQAQLEQGFDKGFRGFGLEHPAENLWIEQVPARPFGDACAGLGPALDHALGGQDADRLAIGRTRNLQAGRRLDFVGQDVAGRVHAVQDIDTQAMGEGAVQAALEHGLGSGRAALFGARRPTGASQPVTKRMERTLRVLSFRSNIRMRRRRSRGFFHGPCHDTEIAV